MAGPANTGMTNIRVATSALTHELMIVRVGKNPNLALDRRNAEADIMCALVDHMTHDMPDGAKKDVKVRGRWFTVSVAPRKRSGR